MIKTLIHTFPTCLIAFFALTNLIVTKIASAGPHTLPPENYTSTTMSVLKRRILTHAEIHNELPKSLHRLIEIESFYNGITDYWGNEITYSVLENEVTLRSNGKDKKPGGNGVNKDVIGVFEAKTSDGVWADPNNDVKWVKQPLH